MPSLLKQIPNSNPLNYKEQACKECIIERLCKRFNGGFISINLEGIITYVSNEFLSLTQHTEEEVLGKNISQFIGSQCFEDSLIKKIPSLLKESIESLTFCGIWETATHKNALYFEFFSSGPLEKDLHGFVQAKQNTDTTLLKQSYLEQIIEHLDAVIWLGSITPPVTFDYISPGFQKIYELSPEAYLENRSLFMERVHPKDRSHLEKMSAEGVNEGSFRYKLKNGTWRHITFYRFLIKDKRKNPSKFAGIAIDTTQLFEAQNKVILHNQELSKKNDQLNKAYAVLDEFTMFACHDILQPIRAFCMYLNILEENYLQDINEDGKLILKSIQAAIERMQQLTTNIGKLSLPTNEFNKPKLVNIERVIEQKIKPIFSTPPIPLCNIETKTLLSLKIKEEHVISILENLISNSIKYNQNFPHIKITSKEFNSFILYTLKDNGIGIPPKMYHKIFELGKRGNQMLGQPGTGIGLYACKKIISSYEGKIWVRSLPGQGSTFYLLFPKNAQSTL